MLQDTSTQKKSTNPLFIISLLLFFPSILVKAASGRRLESFLDWVLETIETLSALGFSVGILIFFLGVTRFIRKADDSSAQEGGRRLLVWGIVVFLVMSSLWGIIIYFQDSFGLGGFGSQSIDQPTIRLR